jgi:outer membrane protease
MRQLFLGILLATALALGAQERTFNLNGHSLSLGAGIGVLYGESEEIVYRDGTSRDYLSQLLWDMKPLVYAGIDGAYHWQKPGNAWGIFTDTTFKFGFPGITGVMEDRDWIFRDPYYKNVPSAVYNTLTHYSVHDNKTENAVLADVDIGISFQIRSFLIKTYFSYNIMYFYWKGQGGSALHLPEDVNGDGKIDPDDATEIGHGYYPNSTVVIDYRQTWHVVSPGVSFYGEFNRYFTGEIGFKISPLIWCISVDRHFLGLGGYNKITDILDIGLFIEPSLSFSFIPTDRFFLSLSAQYRNISLVRGDKAYYYGDNSETYQKYRIQSQTHKNGGGVGYSMLDVGLTAKFNLF